MDTQDDNISTDNQPKGSARNLSDTLNREHEQVAPGQRQLSEDASDRPEAEQNASVRRGGEAAGGVDPQDDDPTSPAAADAHAADRDAAQAERGLGDDGGRSTYKS